MPTAIPCPATDRSGARAGRQLAILIGWNLPAVLWFGYALAKPALGGGVPWCPTCQLLGWCPACGTTTELSRLFYDGVVPGVAATLLACGFAVNAVWSLHRARHAREAA